MGLLRVCRELLEPYLGGARVLSFGYPKLIGDVFSEREDARVWFGGRGVKEFFAVDNVRHPGVDIVVDLDFKVSWQRRFDVVVDGGTLEHCFNVGMAIRNMAQAVEVGGVVFHCPTVSCYNHGFWNVNPTLLRDFYVQNGWEVLHHSLINWHGETVTANGFDATGRYRVHEEISNLFMARRRHLEAFVYPRQSKYGGRGALDKS